jgi:quinol monooxygenase YgiN
MTTAPELRQIIIAGVISIPADRRAACLDATAPWQQATRDDEPGCVAYVFAPDPCDPTAISVFERWTDAASLQAHFTHPNYFGMRSLFAEHGITSADVRKYRVDADAPVYGPDRLASAYFE